MFRTTQTSLIRPIAAAGVLVVVALAAPADAGAQTAGETALLSRLQPTVYIPSGLALVYGAALSGPRHEVDGEQALLARTPQPHPRMPTLVDEDAAPVPTSGFSALLGRRDPSLRTTE